MKKKLNYSYLLLFFAFLFFLPIKSKAVPYPERIQWRASPRAFIISLYQGVLNRQPENQAVVDSWARSVTSDSHSRLSIFWKFIGSREYKNSRWAKLSREYSVYYKMVGEYKRYKSYYVAKFGTDFYLQGKYTFGVAMAIRDYYAAFYSGRRQVDRRNNNSIDLLGVTPN